VASPHRSGRLPGLPSAARRPPGPDTRAIHRFPGPSSRPRSCPQMVPVSDGESISTPAASCRARVCGDSFQVSSPSTRYPQNEAAYPHLAAVIHRPIHKKSTGQRRRLRHLEHRVLPPVPVPRLRYRRRRVGRCHRRPPDNRSRPGAGPRALTLRTLCRAECNKAPSMYEMEGALLWPRRTEAAGCLASPALRAARQDQTPRAIHRFPGPFSRPEVALRWCPFPTVKAFLRLLLVVTQGSAAIHFKFLLHPHDIHKTRPLIRISRQLSTGLYTRNPQVARCSSTSAIMP